MSQKWRSWISSVSSRIPFSLWVYHMSNLLTFPWSYILAVISIFFFSALRSIFSFLTGVGFSFFVFMRRFWNHVFTCLSDRFSNIESSILLSLVIYRFLWNSFSSSKICLLEYDVRLRFPSAKQQFHETNAKIRESKTNW